MCRKACQRDAPSTEAASNSSAGSTSMPAYMHQEHERDRPPRVDQRDRHQGQGRIAEPGGATQPGDVQVVVQRPHVGMKDDPPHGRAHHRHHEEGQQQQHPERAQEAEWLAEEKGEAEPGEELHGHRTGREQPGDHDGSPELRVGGEAERSCRARRTGCSGAGGATSRRGSARRSRRGGPGRSRRGTGAPGAGTPVLPARSTVPLVRVYLPRIRFVPASTSFRAASRVSSPGRELAGGDPEVLLDVGELAKPWALLGDLEAREEGLDVRQGGLGPGSWRTETRGL